MLVDTTAMMSKIKALQTAIEKSVSTENKYVFYVTVVELYAYNIVIDT
jgi:hypothetical protein